MSEKAKIVKPTKHKKASNKRPKQKPAEVEADEQAKALRKFLYPHATD